MTASVKPHPVKKGCMASLRRMHRDGKLAPIFIFLPPALVLFTIFVIWPILNAANFSMYK